MESCSHPQTKRHDVAASGCQGGWEILFGWVVMGWCYYRRREGKSGGGATRIPSQERKLCPRPRGTSGPTYKVGRGWEGPMRWYTVSAWNPVRCLSSVTCPCHLGFGICGL